MKRLIKDNPKTFNERYSDYLQVLHRYKIELQNLELEIGSVQRLMNYKSFIQTCHTRKYGAIAGTVVDKNGIYWDVLGVTEKGEE